MYYGRKCFICGRNGAADPLDKHHIFGGGLRSKSERYGLTVDLCHHRCHQFGPDAVHQNAEVRDELHKYGQRKAMHEQGWTVQEFIYEFGRNYLSEDELDEFYTEENSSIVSVSMFAVLDEAPLPF